jgi:23S rRNA pseudouridine2604 synthase
MMRAPRPPATPAKVPSTKHPPSHAKTAAAPEGERLSKRVAAMMPCSRSEAEQYIEGGWVRVDGRVIEEPQFRVLRQTILIDPDATLLDSVPVTLLLHKPVDWIDGTDEALQALNRQARRSAVKNAQTLLTPASRWQGDTADTRVLQRHFKQLKTCVPLETGASGLVVWTQDWRVQRKLSEDLMFMEHELIAEVRGEVSEQALRILNRELDARGQPLPATKVSLNSTSASSSKLRFAIKGAHPGLVAYRCDQAQLEILALRRIRLGRVALSDLAAGQWRYLAPGERF